MEFNIELKKILKNKQENSTNVKWNLGTCINMINKTTGVLRLWRR